MIIELLLFFSSISALPLSTTDPLPVCCADLIPFLPIINPPVGKSGPGIISLSSSSVVDGLFRIATHPSITSDKLCGGILVAMPTAIPPAPFIRRFGNFEGRTVGSLSEPS